MLNLLLTLALVVLGIVAGIAGAMSGLGGGVIIIPALTLLFGTPIEYAAGASLIATIATSSGAASAYIKERIANIRIGMSLEIATTLGAICGSLAAALIYGIGLGSIIFIVFGAVLLISVYPSWTRFNLDGARRVKADSTTRTFSLRGSYYDRSAKRRISYVGVRWWLGEAIMGIAGFVSGLLGIGSGALKVIGMDWGMKLPIKVTTATSNFMIGVTAAAGAAIYWSLGYIQPLLTGPIVVGVVAGSFIGSKAMKNTSSRIIAKIFIVMLAIVGIEMIVRGLGVA